MKEIIKPTGDSWGGEIMEDCSVKVLKEFSRGTFKDRFRENYSQGWFNIMKNFDTDKRAFDSKKKTKINIDL